MLGLEGVREVYQKAQDSVLQIHLPHLWRYQEVDGGTVQQRPGFEQARPERLWQQAAAGADADLQDIAGGLRRRKGVQSQQEIMDKAHDAGRLEGVKSSKEQGVGTSICGGIQRRGSPVTCPCASSP